MTVYKIHPLQDPRWIEFLQRHPRASVFHSAGWLEALRRTYGYEPVVLTTSPRTAQLSNGLVFCRVPSWLTGHRIVSLPFSEHCEPLVDSLQELEYLLCSLERDLEKENWKYCEIRPAPVTETEKKKPCSRPMHAGHGGQLGKWYLGGNCEISGPVYCAAGFRQSETFYHHRLDLRPPLGELLRSFHKDCIQRKVRRAEREALTYEEGRCESLLSKFYHLLLLTRRRQQLLPLPLNWFRNLIDCMGDSVQIRVASKQGRPVASILTLSYKDSMVYEYGCSDALSNRLGGFPFLFWKTIQEAKDRGLYEFDLGRSDLDNSGLVTFKERWGATRSVLACWIYPASARTIRERWELQIARKILARIPDRLLTAVDHQLYRHVG